jgi:hypothetical protein
MFYSAVVLSTLLASSNAFTPAAPQRIMKNTMQMADEPWFPSSTTTNVANVADLKYVDTISYSF